MKITNTNGHGACAGDSGRYETPGLGRRALGAGSVEAQPHPAGSWPWGSRPSQAPSALLCPRESPITRPDPPPGPPQGQVSTGVSVPTCRAASLRPPACPVCRSGDRGSGLHRLCPRGGWQEPSSARPASSLRTCRLRGALPTGAAPPGMGGEVFHKYQRSGTSGVRPWFHRAPPATLRAPPVPARPVLQAATGPDHSGRAWGPAQQGLSSPAGSLGEPEPSPPTPQPPFLDPSAPGWLHYRHQPSEGTQSRGFYGGRWPSEGSGRVRIPGSLPGAPSRRKQLGLDPRPVGSPLPHLWPDGNCQLCASGFLRSLVLYIKPLQPGPLAEVTFRSFTEPLYRPRRPAEALCWPQAQAGSRGREGDAPLPGARTEANGEGVQGGRASSKVGSSAIGVRDQLQSPRLHFIPTACCVALGRFLNHPVPPCPLLYNGGTWSACQGDSAGLCRAGLSTTSACSRSRLSASLYLGVQVPIPMHLGRVFIKGDRVPQPEWGRHSLGKGAERGYVTLSKKAGVLQLDTGLHFRPPGSLRGWRRQQGAAQHPHPHPRHWF